MLLAGVSAFPRSQVLSTELGLGLDVALVMLSKGFGGKKVNRGRGGLQFSPGAVPTVS